MFHWYALHTLSCSFGRAYMLYARESKGICYTHELHTLTHTPDTPHYRIDIMYTDKVQNVHYPSPLHLPERNRHEILFNINLSLSITQQN